MGTALSYVVAGLFYLFVGSVTNGGLLAIDRVYEKFGNYHTHGDGYEDPNTRSRGHKHDKSPEYISHIMARHGMWFGILAWPLLGVLGIFCLIGWLLSKTGRLFTLVPYLMVKYLHG